MKKKNNNKVKKIKRSDYGSFRLPTEEERKRIEARNAKIKEKLMDKTITLKINSLDLEIIKQAAEADGLKYQTFMKRIVLQAIKKKAA